MNFFRHIGTGQVPPDYFRSIASVLPTALAAIGIRMPVAYHLLHVPWIRGKKYTQLLFYFLDSLGLAACKKSGGLFARLLKSYGLPLTSVFPSITSTALCSIYTGVPPARHGILGHKIYFEEIRSLVDVLKMVIPDVGRPITGVGLPVRHWLCSPSLLSAQFLGRRQAVHLSPHPILHSGISDMIYPAEIRREGYEEYIEGLGKVDYLLRAGADVINFYQHGVDESTHKFGGESSQAMFSIRNIEQGVAWLADHLPVSVRRRTLFVLVSDHGQNTFVPRRILHFPFQEIQRLKKSSGLRAIGTSGRLAHVYSESFPNPPLEKWLADRCRGKATVVPRHTSWRLAGGAGPLPPHGGRLGDYTLLLNPGVKLRVEFSPPEEDNHLRFSAANHGSLSLDELMVPALFVPMDEVAK